MTDRWGMPLKKCPHAPECRVEGVHVTHGGAGIECRCRLLPCAYCKSLMMGGRSFTRLSDGRVAHTECQIAASRAAEAEDGN